MQVRKLGMLSEDVYRQVEMTRNHDIGVEEQDSG